MLEGLKTIQVSSRKQLTDSEKISVYYHNIFEFPLSDFELIKWTAGNIDNIIKKDIEIIYKNGAYFLDGSEALIYKKKLRQRISEKKMFIARAAANRLASIPWIKLVGLTGSLAMNNSTHTSDIDFLIITTHKRLWTTRILAFALLRLSGYVIRRSGDQNEKDKLCLNMWMDENDLVWRNRRNLYTAHEIAQVVPLINKNKTYENFMSKNRWIKKYWPNSVKIKNRNISAQSINGFALGTLFSLVERVFYRIQLKYMKTKITREIITPTRAVFHPYDWGEYILAKLSY